MGNPIFLIINESYTEGLFPCITIIWIEAISILPLMYGLVVPLQRLIIRVSVEKL